ncbi:MAG TPA: PEP/pyruvate-binding domain-containing protein [Flavobacteriales bacterium]|nr:PEP/pyruvate-binding domain-containing protein [Flavobacteriales bacterium]
MLTALRLSLAFYCLTALELVSAQQVVPILNYTTNANGQVELEVASTPLFYYVLEVRHSPEGAFETATSVTMGQPGSTVITEPLGNYPLENYQVRQYSIQAAGDLDDDGRNDVVELLAIPNQSPLNAAQSTLINDGLVAVDQFTTFKELSITRELVPWNEYLNGKVFVKYMIADFYTDHPKLYFINTNTYPLHENFANALGIDFVSSEINTGHIIYHPSTISNNGTLGTFAFNFSGGNYEDFSQVQKVHEMLAANMPFIRNNLSYFVIEQNESQFVADSLLFEASRVPVLHESDVYADVNYWGLNPAEGFGFFRQLATGEVPGAKDIVLYESLPTTLPRVGGIITSVIQTPLSHVNLRAIQNHIPNAFIRDPLLIDSIAALMNHYIYFKVEQERYFIREATLDEVNAWHENLRPLTEQIPPLNLTYTSVLPLSEITFNMFDGFGAKCANVATMRTFGFPEGTIPDGFGVPFYFYQEFMSYNNLFEEIETIMANPAFISDRNVRDDLLDDFREQIEDAQMPPWMLTELSAMQTSFPVGTSIRCRSSTNNEDLPGFNGAGLYDSKTQHPDEGHISKSIKQVYASLWNLRAFEEREFYRINHFKASMAVLCHPNHEDEKVNGVGVSTDPIYNSENTFYLNSQVGDDLITNPGANTIAEEILLDRVSMSENDFIIIQHSNLVPADSVIMTEEYLEQMRSYFSVIHDQFEVLYKAVGNSTFAMDIEYKITSDDKLVIKQARPWVSYVYQEQIPESEGEHYKLEVFPSPASSYISIYCRDCEIGILKIYDVQGRLVHEQSIANPGNVVQNIAVGHLNAGFYIVSGTSADEKNRYSRRFMKN